jgi:hypothetical protein
MRTLIIATMLAILTCSAFSGEVALSLDQAIVFPPSPESTSYYGAVMAIGFSLPDSLDSIKVVYAELNASLDFSTIAIGSDSALRITGYPINHEWDANTIWINPWVTPGADLDTMLYFSYAITMGDPEKQTIYLDITSYVSSVLAGSKANYGILLMPKSYDESAYLLPQIIANQIREKGVIRIIYQ